MRYISLLLFLSISFQGLKAQTEGLLSGPMLGYNTVREVAIWVQTKKESEVSIKYWNAALRKDKTETKKFKTTYEKAYTATVAIGYLDPGTTYSYQILVDGKPANGGREYLFTTQELWHYRKPPPEFSFVTGSCMFVNEAKFDRKGKPYGQGNKIFESIAKENADFMLWLGDNVYLREADWNSRSGIYHRYTHMRQVPELKDLMHKMHHYAIWDDHDYGPNDSDWTYWNKEITKEAFQDFWANPNYSIGGSEGITGTYWWNDCQFFLMDNRWYRTPQAEDGEILGEQQVKWLIDALRTSKANFKFVSIGGQFITDFAKYENHAVYAQERQKILDLIDEYDIKNVVFLNGDRHSSELSRFVTEDGDVIYDITSSPLSSRSYDHDEENNSFRVGNTIGELNYAVIKVSGTSFKGRSLTLEYKDVDGKVLSTYPLDFTIEIEKKK